MGKKIKPLATPDLNQVLTPALLGQIIKARRTQSQLRLEDAASLCGLAKQTYMKIEHGNKNSHIENILKICAQLGIKLYVAPLENNNGEHDDWQ
ncbi:MAG: helix-turn-helix transcriptional regulator [Legionellales bacterium]|nr:helix-turn-helix transcriptional regulator [Legionellales bacterium]